MGSGGGEVVMVGDWVSGLGGVKDGEVVVVGISFSIGDSGDEKG